MTTMNSMKYRFLGYDKSKLGNNHQEITNINLSHMNLKELFKQMDKQKGRPFNATSLVMSNSIQVVAVLVSTQSLDIVNPCAQGYDLNRRMAFRKEGEVILSIRLDNVRAIFVILLQKPKKIQNKEIIQLII